MTALTISAVLLALVETFGSLPFVLVALPRAPGCKFRVLLIAPTPRIAAPADSGNDIRSSAGEALRCFEEPQCVRKAHAATDLWCELLDERKIVAVQTVPEVEALQR
jgi:hypothetical protein